jgi:hypothetical protein
MRGKHFHTRLSFIRAMTRMSPAHLGRSGSAQDEIRRLVAPPTTTMKKAARRRPFSCGDAKAW